MTIRQTVSSFVLAIATFFNGADTSAQTRSVNAYPATTAPTWSEFVTDLKPYLKVGETGAAIGQQFWEKYRQKPVEWTGKFKSCNTIEGKLWCDVTMAPIMAVVKDGPQSGTVIDVLSVFVLPTDAENWRGLKVGRSIRFAGNTSAAVFVVPAKESGRHPVVSVHLSEGRLLSPQ